MTDWGGMFTPFFSWVNTQQIDNTCKYRKTIFFVKLWKNMSLLYC